MKLFLFESTVVLITVWILYRIWNPCLIPVQEVDKCIIWRIELGDHDARTE